MEVKSTTIAGPVVPIIVPALVRVAPSDPVALFGLRRINSACAPVTVAPAATSIEALNDG